MGSFPGKQYAANLARDGVEIQRSMAAGEVLAGQFGAGARTYGRMTQVLGHSQWEIATGLGAASIGFMNYQKEELAPAADAAAESLFPGMVAPAQGRARRPGAHHRRGHPVPPASLTSDPRVGPYQIAPSARVKVYNAPGGSGADRAGASGAGPTGPGLGPRRPVAQEVR